MRYYDERNHETLYNKVLGKADTNRDGFVDDAEWTEVFRKSRAFYYGNHPERLSNI